ncbi:MAG: hypothetical protein NT129_02745 [Candidatus Aenigmarchaeota archaeon]|nr:hypothetical protein [Candidatus Aenigmarchaeota archaeon]
MEKAFVVAVLLTLLITFSGCTSPGTDMNDSEPIKIDFDADYSTYTTGDDINLLLDIINNDENDMRNVTATIEVTEPDYWKNFTATKGLGDILGSDASTGTPGGFKHATWILEAPTIPGGDPARSYIIRVKITYDTGTIERATGITVISPEEAESLKKSA